MTTSVESAVRLCTWIAGWIGRGVVALKSLGPYAAIELILPGGSVLALLLWLYRRHRKSTSTSRTAFLTFDSSVGSLVSTRWRRRLISAME